MYAIYIGEVCVYDDSLPIATKKVVDPLLTLEDNTGGSLDFTLPPINTGYDAIKRYKDLVAVIRTGYGVAETVWLGRIASDTKGFNNCRAIYCEGILSFLNDTIQPRKRYSGNLKNYIKGVLSEHNLRVPSSRQIVLDENVFDANVKSEGYDKTIVRWTEYRTTYETLTDLIEEFYLHFTVRRSDGVFYLDVKDDLHCFNSGITHTISFGKNLLDFNEEYNISNLITALLPLGATKDKESSSSESSESPPSDYYTISSATDTGGFPFVKSGNYILSEEDIAAFGRYEAVVNFDEIKDPNELYRLGASYLVAHCSENATFEIKAVDGIFSGTSTAFMKMYDKVNLISCPHGKKMQPKVIGGMPILKMEIPLNQPGNTTFTINHINKKTLTDTYRKAVKAAQITR